MVKRYVILIISSSDFAQRLKTLIIYAIVVDVGWKTDTVYWQRKPSRPNTYYVCIYIHTHICAKSETKGRMTEINPQA